MSAARGRIPSKQDDQASFYPFRTRQTPLMLSHAGREIMARPSHGACRVAGGPDHHITEVEPPAEKCTGVEQALTYRGEDIDGKI